MCLAESNASRYENTPVTVAGWGTISSGGPQVTGQSKLGGFQVIGEEPVHWGIRNKGTISSGGGLS